MKKNSKYYKKQNKKKPIVIRRNYYPSENNRLTRIYETNKNRRVENIVCVSLEAKIKRNEGEIAELVY